jgi:hypothetical protein
MRGGGYEVPPVQTVSREDLGHGVVVEGDGAGGLVVASRTLPLPWHGPAGRTPGTAVVWRGDMFEVLREAGGNWELRPWGTAVARGVFVLDADSVGRVAGQRGARARTVRAHDRLTLIEPIAGLAPAEWQRRWQRENGFHALRATFVGGFVTGVAGVVGVLDLMARGIGGAGFLPTPWRWLAGVGPLLVAEAFVRVGSVVALERPAGSIVGLPLLLLRRRHDAASRGAAS